MDGTLTKGNDFFTHVENYINGSSNLNIKKVIGNLLEENNITSSDLVLDHKLKKVKFKSEEDLKLYKVNDFYILKPNSEYYSLKETLGDEVIENVYKIFKNSENNCIITGRRERMRNLIEDNLQNLNINTKVYLTPNHIKSSEDTAKNKFDILKEKSEKYNLVMFFDDKESWLDIIKKECLVNEIKNIRLFKVENGKVFKYFN